MGFYDFRPPEKKNKADYSDLIRNALENIEECSPVSLEKKKKKKYGQYLVTSTGL